MLNQCVLIGNLGDNPSIFYSADGDPIANFNLAFKSSHKKTGWIRITAFGKLADRVERCLHKGAKVAVSGYLDENKWETENGKTNSRIQIVARSIEFIKIDGRGFESESLEDKEPF